MAEIWEYALAEARARKKGKGVMMTELKACPFCGKTEGVSRAPMASYRTDEYATCDCIYSDSTVISVDQWNARPLESALEARVKNLESELAQARVLIDDLCFALVNADPEMPHSYEVEALRLGLEFIGHQGKSTGAWDKNVVAVFAAGRAPRSSVAGEMRRERIAIEACLREWFGAPERGHGWNFGAMAAQVRVWKAAIGYLEVKPIEEWHEDDGYVLFWTLPGDDPPYIGSPLCSDFPAGCTHWTRIPPMLHARREVSL